MCATQRTVPPAHWNFNSQPLHCVTKYLLFPKKLIEVFMFQLVPSRIAQVGPHLNTASSGHTAG